MKDAVLSDEMLALRIDALFPSIVWDDSVLATKEVPTSNERLFTVNVLAIKRAVEI